MNVSNIEELKKLGKFKEVREKIKQDINADKMIKISGRSWKDLYQSIEKFKEVICKLQGQDNLTVNEPKGAIASDNQQMLNGKGYFTRQDCEYIFYLVELDGKLRMDKLGITPTLFSSQKAAKKWRDKISKAIHPDHCSHEKANEAMAQLNALYHQMTGGE